ncbi:MAG: hypothetical protein R3230_01080 [Nitrosopumilaceae archaeon]|nr:hypothetical protein [Nitrosopumilaceae archaeon]
MIKQELICPNCDEQSIVVTEDNKAQFCPLCGDPIDEDERGELEMGDDQ